MSAPYIINEFEKVVEALPDGSLARAYARGALLSDRGVKSGKEAGGEEEKMIMPFEDVVVGVTCFLAPIIGARNCE